MTPVMAASDFEQQKASADVMKPILFVTGASRSGTTMLARMFGGHSRILALNETHYFGSLCDPENAHAVVSESTAEELATALISRHRRGLWCGVPTAQERFEAAAIISGLSLAERNPFEIFFTAARYLAAESGKAVACEQTPRNIFYARKLLERYPGAYVVHIVRDPRGVLASQKNRWKLRELGAAHLPAREMIRNRINYHPITICRLWTEANNEAVGLEGHERFRIVRFEDLAAAPEEKARELCHLLQVSFEPQMLDLPQWGSSNLSHTSESRGVSKDVVDRWGRVLSPSEVQVCEAMTAGLMSRFGYVLHTSGSLKSLKAIPSFLSYPFHVAAVLAFNPSRAMIQMKALYGARMQSKVA